MMNRISSIRAVERVNRIGQMSGQMFRQGSFGRAREEQEAAFSDSLKEACRHNEDSLARSMENKVSYYGSDAQAVFYTMAISKGFKA